MSNMQMLSLPHPQLSHHSHTANCGNVMGVAPPSTACTAVQSSLGSLTACSLWTDLGLPGLTISLLHPSPMGARQNGSAARAWAFPSAQGGRSGDGCDKWPPALSPAPCSSCLMQSFSSPACIAGRGCLTSGTLIRSGEVCSALRGLRGWHSVQVVLLWIVCHSFSLENCK